MGRHIEDSLQIELNERLREIAKIPEFKEHIHWMYHIENEGLKTAQQAQRSKLMGVKSGVSDLSHPCPFYVELKRPPKGKDRGGVASEAQLKFLAYCESIGTPTLLTCDINEAEFFIISQLSKFTPYSVDRLDPPQRLMIDGMPTMNHHSVLIRSKQ